MKFYVSAKWHFKDRVREIQEMIKLKGHEIAENWTTRAFERNYDKFERSGEFSERELDAILDSDVFIHLSDGGGKGKYVDLGIALGGNKLQGKPGRIYVLGTKTNESQHYFNSAIRRRKTIEDVFEDLRI
ncbi:MAG: hypothetical protein KJI71_05430 [Patescibacteria group bacterium]|nr:hypothetical protein [Patescibacteria group bacterium]